MPRDVDTWLKELELSEYSQAFAENRIDAEVLPTLTNDDLKDIGVLAVGDRRKILNAIKAMSERVDEPTGDATSEQDPSREPERTFGAERRQLTVMFCDLVGSTDLSGRLDPEDLHDLMRRYQDAVAGVVARFEGHVAKFLGDGVLAYFGWPRAYEDQAERAVRSGLAAVDAVANVKTEDGQALAARVGIATGQVVIGDMVGETATDEDAVVGETPNLAARLQGAASPGQVVIGSNTRLLIGEAFDLTDLGSRELKGIGDSVAVWSVVGESAVESRFEAAHPGARTQITGRAPELELLWRAWGQSRKGVGQVVLINGEPGIGKSRLVDALSDKLGDERYTPITLGCSPYHTNSALYPLIVLLERVLGWEREDSADSRLAKLERELQNVSLPLDEVIPLFAALLSLPLPDDRFPASSLTPQQQKQQTLDAVVAWLLEEAERRPVLWVWEDLHWADPSTIELLDLVIEQTPTAPILNVMTFRPDFTPPWPQRSHMTPLTLNRLERPEVETLIGQHAGGKALPEEVVEHIFDKTDGVPLYVEELTKAILEADFLREHDGGYRLTGPMSGIAIPATLQDSLMARLDRLPNIREVAQLGAVLGREFAYEMVQPIASIEETTLQNGLDQLVAAELLYQRGRPPRAKYVFKHALVQDAAYQSLLKRTRQYYHGQVAELLESRFPEIVQSHSELVAHHLTEAGLAERAIARWREAGLRAAGRSANAEAIGHLTKALGLIASLDAGRRRDEIELDLRADLVTPLIAAKGYSSPELEETFVRALQLGRELGATAQLFPLLYGRWAFHLTTGQLRDGLAFGEEFLRLAEAEGDDDLGIMGHRVFGISLLNTGRPKQAKVELERALASYNPERHRALAQAYGQDVRVGILCYLAISSWCLGHPDRALNEATRALTQADHVGHANTEGYAKGHTALVFALAGHLESVQENVDGMTALLAEHPLPVWEAVAKVYHGFLLLRQGHHRQALAAFEQGFVDLDLIHFKYWRPIFISWQAETYAALGKTDRALTSIDRALALVKKSGESWAEADLSRIKGEILCTNDVPDAAEAEVCFREAIEIARHQQARSLELRAATSLAHLWQTEGKAVKARELLAPIYDWFTEGFDTADLKEAKALLDELA
jgi:class 3 adenylate cyclase/predicted ATPase